MKERPFDNFKTAITDPSYFFGRSQLIETVRKSPFRVRILLGGRRIGKTSTLRALEWSLLDYHPGKPRRAFPVFISLQYEQPQDLDNLRYILVARLREAIERWQKVPPTLLRLREKYREYRRQVAGANVTFNFLKTVSAKFDITNPDYERRLLRDDFRQALLSTIDELKKWDYEFEGVCFLLDEAEFVVRKDWADDAWSFFRGLKDTDTAWENLFNQLIQDNKHHFKGWWNQDGKTDGFGEPERSVYKALVENRKEAAENLSKLVNLSQNDVMDALEVLAGTGVIRQLDEEYYVVGAQLFEKWIQE